MIERKSAPTAVTAAGFGAFFLIGVVVASYGPSIPRIVDRFGVAVSVAGLIVSAHFLGSCVGITVFGLPRSRWAIGRRLMLGASLFSIGSLGAAAAPSWPLLLTAVFILGSGAGGLAVLVNVYFATRFGWRGAAMLSLVNAAYGAGAFVGPTAVAIAHGYPPILAGAGGIGLACSLLIRRAPTVPPTQVVTQRARDGTAGTIIAFALLLLVYAGIESGIGTWEASALLASGWSLQIAAGATSLYWGAFTLGRIIGAPLTARIPPQRLLFSLLAVVTFVLVGIRAHLDPRLGFALVGLCAGPIVPVALAWLSRVVPDATTAVTFAILGIVLGSALLPAALGGLIGRIGVQSLPLGVAACSVVSFGIVAIISARSHGQDDHQARQSTQIG
jgi:FHS family glucose/mannose:H+ symporter-like MFS transporter